MAAPLDHQTLKNDLARSREAMTVYVAALGHDLDVGAKLKHSVKNSPLAWSAAAGVIGLLLSKIPPLRSKVVVQGPKPRKEAPRQAGLAALAVTLLKFALDFAKPALLRWLKERYLGPVRPFPGTTGSRS